MPQANTLIHRRAAAVGRLVGRAEGRSCPQIIDVETSHPLMQWIDLGDVVLLEGTPLNCRRAAAC